LTTINPAHMQVSRKTGSIVLEQHPDIEVDVHHPQVTVYVEIRAKDCYVYAEVLACGGGAPGRYQWACYAAPFWRYGQPGSWMDGDETGHQTLISSFL